MTPQERRRRMQQQSRNRQPNPVPVSSNKPQQGGKRSAAKAPQAPKPKNLIQAVATQAKPLVQNIQAAQQKFRQATPLLQPVANIVEAAAAKSDYLPTDIAGTGAAVLAQKAGVPPAALLPLGLLTGAVYKTGPRAGTVKQGGALRTKYPNQINDVEDALEVVYKNTNEAGGKLSKAYPPDKRTVYDFGDGTEVYAFDGGGFDYPNRNGIRLKTRPSTNKPNPVPNPSTKVDKPAPIPPTTNKSPDLAQRRFTPMDKDPSIKESRSQIDKRVRNPDLPRDLIPGKGPSETAPPVPLGELRRDIGKDSPTRGQLAIGPYERGTAKAGQAYANAHLSVDGSGVASPFKVAETQAHHSTSPLKDAGDFTRGFNDEQMAIFRAKTEAAGVYAGDTQLNTAYLRQPYHQGNKAWPEAKQSAVHPNLQSRVLEAKASQDRWAHMTPEQRLENIDYFIEDALLGQRLAQEAEFSQTLLQAGNNAFDNPFGGNLSQSVLAPLNKHNLRQISKKRQDARQVLRRLPTKGQIAKDAALN